MLGYGWSSTVNASIVEIKPIEAAEHATRAQLARAVATPNYGQFSLGPCLSTQLLTMSKSYRCDRGSSGYYALLVRRLFTVPRCYGSGWHTAAGLSTEASCEGEAPRPSVCSTWTVGLSGPERLHHHVV
jgi:hypothetical protein